MITLEELMATPDGPMSDNWNKHFDRCLQFLPLIVMERDHTPTLSAMDEGHTPSVHKDDYCRPTHVYFIQDSSGLIKIGKAHNVERRMSNYRTHNPSFIIIGIVKNGFEDSIHRQLKHLRVKGEWFRNDNNEVMDAFYALGGVSYNEFCGCMKGG